MNPPGEKLVLATIRDATIIRSVSRTMNLGRILPIIQSFTPTSGAVGATVTIQSFGFTGTTAVDIDGVAAQFTVVSGCEITATLPTGAQTRKSPLPTREALQPARVHILRTKYEPDPRRERAALVICR
jgi:hypothetical protein